jgi:Diguanylate cyclase, GGDEF domain
VIGRAGGEEFVIADIDSVTNPAEMAERLRQAIAGLPMQITASIGTASAPVDTDIDRGLIDGLVGAADAAMYDAKRAGGNRIRQSRRCTSRTVTAARPGSWPSMTLQIAMHRSSHVGLACWSPVRSPERKVSLLLPLSRGVWLMAIGEVRL